MRELSVFIDESGDFGSYEPHCPFYIITMVFFMTSAPASPRQPPLWTVRSIIWAWTATASIPAPSFARKRTTPF